MFNIFNFEKLSFKTSTKILVVILIGVLLISLSVSFVLLPSPSKSKMTNVFIINPHGKVVVTSNANDEDDHSKKINTQNSKQTDINPLIFPNNKGIHQNIDEKTNPQESSIEKNRKPPSICSGKKDAETNPRKNIIKKAINKTSSVDSDKNSIHATPSNQKDFFKTKKVNQSVINEQTVISEKNDNKKFIEIKPKKDNEILHLPGINLILGIPCYIVKSTMEEGVNLYNFFDKSIEKDTEKSNININSNTILKTEFSVEEK